MRRYDWNAGITISICVTIFISTQRILGWEGSRIFDFLTFTLFVFLFCLFNWVAHIFLIRYGFSDRIWPPKNLRNRILSGLTSIVLVTASGCLYGIIFLLAVNYGQIKGAFGSQRSFFLFRSFALSGFYYFIVYYIDALQQKQKALLEIERLKQTELQARLSSLKEQLSPHFMFNTLNTLANLTREQPVKTYINELANVYRYVLQYKENEFVTLRQELAFIKSYFHIIQTRFEDAVFISIKIDDDLQASKMPPLTLQMLVENAVKHNVTAEYKPLYISLYSEGKDYIIVCNNYQPKVSVIPSTNKGLENIALHYDLLFNKEIGIERSDDSFKVKLPVVI